MQLVLLDALVLVSVVAHIILLFVFLPARLGRWLGTPAGLVALGKIRDYLASDLEAQIREALKGPELKASLSAIAAELFTEEEGGAAPAAAPPQPRGRGPGSFGREGGADPIEAAERSAQARQEKAGRRAAVTEYLMLIFHLPPGIAKGFASQAVRYPTWAMRVVDSQAPGRLGRALTEVERATIWYYLSGDESELARLQGGAGEARNPPADINSPPIMSSTGAPSSAP